MRILKWVQGRVNGKNEKNIVISCRKDTSQSDNNKDEFDDWPQSFFAIGTFGNVKSKKDLENLYFSEEAGDLTTSTVRVVNVQNEKSTSFSYMSRRVPFRSETQFERKSPLDTSLNRISHSQKESTTFQRLVGDMEDGNEDDLYPDSRRITARTKYFHAEHQSVFKRNTLSFLIKRLLSHKGSFTPASGLRDPISESRMKIFKAMLHRKICLDTFDAKTSVRRNLYKKSANGKASEKQLQDKPDDGCVWNKTDSEYIVLEI